MPATTPGTWNVGTQIGVGIGIRIVPAWGVMEALCARSISRMDELCASADVKVLTPWSETELKLRFRVLRLEA